ncbi:hypothetical protein [Bacillus cereus]|uniref:hypothetical protein n=1 Tax=Bacillus cereus TaxID=1396 RepID=UPI000BF6BFB4|nr:hypothetical protein [Bacillus cereus]PFI75665.1 hypothetical protein COI83_29940 [Bacillus cereus]
MIKRLRNIKHDKYELLEIFESEPEDYYIPGAGAYRYSKIATLGFELVMNMFYYDATVELIMLYEDKRIIETKMESVKEIYTRNDSLYILGTEEKKKIKVKFKPYFTVTINEF